jgi:hypothetical protein
MTKLADPPAPCPLAPRRSADWAEVLEPGERLLWQGRPDPGLRLRWRHLPLALVGAMIVGLAGLLAEQALTGLTAGDEGAGALLALAAGLGGFGLWCLLAPAIGDMLRRRGTAYALTERRALVETDFLGRGLAAWPITAESPIWLQPGRPGSACFGIHRPRAGIADRLLRGGPALKERAVCFECVAEAERLVALLEDVREGKA